MLIVGKSAITAFLTSLVFIFPVTAHAASVDEDQRLAHPAEAVTTEKYDSQCLKARVDTGTPGSCDVVTTGRASASEVVDPATVPVQDLSLRSADGTTLEAALATGTVYTRTWWQEQRGFYYINWLEKHSGRIYWDGSQVWSTTLNRGYKGYHVCDQGYGIGYDVVVKSCFTERLGTTALNEWDMYRVHVIYKGIPLYSSQDMRAYANRYGNMSFYY